MAAAEPATFARVLAAMHEIVAELGRGYVVRAHRYADTWAIEYMMLGMLRCVKGTVDPHTGEYWCPSLLWPPRGSLLDVPNPRALVPRREVETIDLTETADEH